MGGKNVQTRPASGRTHKDLRGVLYILALAGYASPGNNYNIVARSKTQARPKFFTATPRVAYELHRVYVRPAAPFDADVSRKKNRV